MRRGACILGCVALIAACSSDPTTTSTAPTIPDAGPPNTPLTGGTLTDPSIVSGDCAQGDAGYQCPAGQGCVVFQNIAISGTSCQDGQCPKCVIGSPDLSSLVKCNDSTRRVFLLASSPPQLVCES